MLESSSRTHNANSTPMNLSPTATLTNLTPSDIEAGRKSSSSREKFKPPQIDNEFGLEGSGTEEDPYIVHFKDDDKENPRNWGFWYRWFLSSQGSLQMFAITFATSAYTGGYRTEEKKFGINQEIATTGLTTYVMGLALGALVWAPMSELYGRRIVSLGTLLMFTAFGIGVAFAQNLETILICRFFMALAGSSVMSNVPGFLTDVWRPSEISLPMTLSAVMPFGGPSLAPVVSSYVGQYAGTESWRYVNLVCFCFGGFVFLMAIPFSPETYPLTLLQRRAKKMMKENPGLHFIPVYEKGHGKKKALDVMGKYLARPFVFLFQEPIVFFLSAYCALIFGILYIFFDAYPIMFGEYRGWSEGNAALPFVGIFVGLIIGIPIGELCKRPYLKKLAASENGRAPPEDRLWFAMVASVLLPISLFWMAGGSKGSVNYWVPTLAGVPFGIGILGMMTAVLSYLGDSYTIYAASAFAANSLFRYVLGATFPLFAQYMFARLGGPWSLALLGFVALACMPMPYLFYRYGEKIRSHSKHVPDVPVPVHRLPSGKPEQPPIFIAASDVDVRVEEERDGIVDPARQ